MPEITSTHEKLLLLPNHDWSHQSNLLHLQQHYQVRHQAFFTPRLLIYEEKLDS